AAAQVALGVGEEAVADEPVDDLALELERVTGEAEQAVEVAQHPGLVARVEVAEPGAVDGDDAERAGLLGRAEEPVAALEQLAQVELQAAAHGADLARFELGVDEVL